MLNKIIVRQSVLFYAEAWRHRNEVLHEPLKYKSFVIELYKNIGPEMKRYLSAQEINVGNCDNACTSQWNLNTIQMRKTSKEEKVNDIGRFLVMK